MSSAAATTSSTGMPEKVVATYGTVSAARVTPRASTIGATTSVMPACSGSARVRAAAPSSTSPVAVSSGKTAPTRTRYPKSAGLSTCAITRTRAASSTLRLHDWRTRSDSSRMGVVASMMSPRSGGCRCARSKVIIEKEYSPLCRSRTTYPRRSSTPSTRKICPTLRPVASPISVCPRPPAVSASSSRMSRPFSRAGTAYAVSGAGGTSGSRGISERRTVRRASVGRSRGRCPREPAGRPG